MFHNFVIAGGLNANPAKVSMTLDPVKLDAKMGIAVKSIAYGELQNVNATNNVIKIHFDHANMIRAHSEGKYKGGLFAGTHTVTVSPAHYDSRLDIAESLIATANSYLASKGFNGRFEVKNHNTTITIIPPSYTTLSSSSMLTYLGAEDEGGVWEMNNGKLVNRQIMGCLYLNIVENSFINGKKSRILCMCPFDYQPGYAFLNLAIQVTFQ